MIVDNKEPVKTPIFTPPIYSTFSTKAKLPTNKLIVKPIPVKIPTPYKFNQLALFGISVIFNFIEMKENKKTPICFPKNNPNNIPKGTTENNELNFNPSRETPALAKANKGIIINAT